MDSQLNSVILNKVNQAFFAIFNQLPNTIFWVKDKNLTIIKINQAFADYLNLNENQIIGKTDVDLYPKELATNFTIDDNYVIQTGKPIKGKLELILHSSGAVEWRKIIKLPIFDEKGNVIGTTGISRPFDNANEDIPLEYQKINSIVDHTSDHLEANINVKKLAEFAGVSESTLNRRFKEYLQITPQQFIAQLRINKACKLLRESVLSMAEIADACGYESPTAFSRAFKAKKHVSPRDYRNR